EAADVAGRIEARQGALDLSDGVERAGQCGLGAFARRDAHLDERAEQRPRAARPGSHPSAPLRRASSTTATMRRTPSVTCWQLSVAPLMLAMSSPTRSGDAADFPTNCRRHAGSRISPPWLSRYDSTSTCFTVPS